jgi:hypothetical protein
MAEPSPEELEERRIGAWFALPLAVSDQYWSQDAGKFQWPEGWPPGTGPDVKPKQPAIQPAPAAKQPPADDATPSVALFRALINGGRDG